ncbi:MAG: hypothetical protein KGN34_01145 [Sphingomonadales bacterium]|nr:hypothetical protein [Sphingomonadales bacterium]
MPRNRRSRAAARSLAGNLNACTLLGCASVVAMSVAASTPAAAQAIERNPAPTPQAAAPRIPPAPLADPAADATPLGVALGSIAVGADAALAPAAPGTVSLAAPRPMPRLEARLRGFLGQPLSLKLVAQIKAAVAGEWRQAGFPFVRVTAPRQDLSGGRLVLRIDEYRLGSAHAEGADADEAARIAHAIRQQPGGSIATDPLIEDLDWLNKYPFRRVEAVFSAGKAVGETDATWKVGEGKRWSVGAGYANTGSPDAGMNRAFIQVLAGLPGSDAWASYQLTTSGQRFTNLGNPPSGSRRYISHAAHLAVPLAPRTTLEVDFGDIASAQPVDAFDAHQHTQEWSLIARTALSNLAPSLSGEIYGGFAWKRQRGHTLFGGTEIAQTAYNVGTFTLGYAWHRYDSRGETGLDLALHASPGGLGSLATDAAYAAASRGGFTKARFLYATGSFYRHTRFGDFSLNNSLSWQFSGAQLPGTEQTGLGGHGQVRAYTLDDGAFDRAVVLRNELRRDMKPLGAGTQAAWAPWLYVDAGYAGQAATGKASHAIGAVGAGIDVNIARNFSITADGGVALADQGNTRAGDLRGNVRATLRF